MNQPSTASSPWDQFWYARKPLARMRSLRIGACVVALIYLLTLVVNVESWWGPTGWQTAELSRQLAVASQGIWPARFRLSPLWLTSSAGMIQAWCAVGILATCLAMANKFTRAALIVCCLCILSLAQRLTWSTGLLEPTLVAMLAYLAIYDWGRSSHWTQGFASRLIEVHLWLLLAAALLAQITATTWWRGEATWWLASTGHSNLLRTEMLSGRLLLINAVTYSITLSSVIAVWGLWPLASEVTGTSSAKSSGKSSGKLLPSSLTKRRRRCGMLAAFYLAAAYALLADQLTFGILLAVITQAQGEQLQASRLQQKILIGRC